MSAVALAFEVPKEQRLIYRIMPAPGRLMSMDSIGGQMTALAKMLKSLLRDGDPTAKWSVLILRISTEESGAVEFEVAMAMEAKPDTLRTQRKLKAPKYKE